MPIKFLSDLAFRFAHPYAFSKGEKYFEDGAVSKVRLEGQTYKSVVEGTRLYNVDIVVKSEDDIKATCTCPYEGEGICKHAVATILALANNPELATVNIQNKAEQLEQWAEKLLAKANETQIRKFLRQLLFGSEQAVHDFDIFLQGTKETFATVQSYKAKIIKKLDELDLEDLEQAWMSSGDDFYDYHPGWRDFKYDEETLPNIVNPFRQEAQKYADNKNFAESGKIFQAIIEALRDKDEEISKQPDLADLSDWFFNQINEILNLYYKVLSATDEPGIKQAGLEYLSMLFEIKQFEWNQKELAEGLKEAVNKKSEAEICLRQLSVTIKKQDSSPAESSLLSRLYFMAGDEEQFEKTSLTNLEKNPGLSLELLKFYKRNNRKPDILKIADQVLSGKKSDSFDWDSPKDVEIEIREFLKTIFDPKTEYAQIIGNLEALFFRSKKLNDYKELTMAYGKPEEKEKFLTKMKDGFAKQHEIEIMFKVFKLEDRKREILELTGKYKDEQCFSDMIAFISNVYPQESFDNYQVKIEHLLKDSNVKYYPQVAYHLKRMKQIGLAQDFKKFVEWIVANYKRRSKLMEELQKGGLI